MTNEELALAIQAGERERLEELWEQVRRFAWWRARRVLGALDGSREADLDDLMQAAFLALVAAVEYYDPEKGVQLLTYYKATLKTAFAEATGWRTAKQQRDPMHRSDSLDQPMDWSDPDGNTLGDLVADPGNPMEAVEERLYRDWQRETIAKALDKLPADQARILRLRYWEGLTLAQVAQEYRIHLSTVRQRESKALRTLSRRKEIRSMRRYVEQRTDYYRGGQNPVAANVLWRDDLERRWAEYHGTEHNGGPEC